MLTWGDRVKARWARQYWGATGVEEQTAAAAVEGSPMTHLTQVTLDFAAAARLRLHDCYDWHQAVWKAFPGRDGKRAISLCASTRVGGVLPVDRVARGTRAARLV